MPIRRGRFAPQNTFLETIAQKFDRGNSNFVLGSAQEKNNYPIVYCSDGFCELTGFSRSDLMRRSCACNFLYGLESNQDDIYSIENALKTQKELKKEILFYKKNGSPFYCLLDVVPIKNEKGNVVLFLVSHKDVTKRKLSNEVHDEEGSSNGGSKPKSKLSRSRSRKFSRDVLLHLSRQYQQNNNANKTPARRSVKRSRSFSFTSERLPQYKRETTKKSKFLFLHYSTKKGLWDWWILVLTFYIAIMVPYNVAFSRHGKARDLIIVDMVIELFFILDIVVHFRTTYVNNTGRIVYEQKAIAVHYLKGWFVLDFLAALPFEALYFINQSWASAAFDRKGSAFKEGFLVQLLKCGRLLRLFRVVRKLHRYTEYSTVLLTLLMMAFAMVAHWLACVWYVIGLEEVREKSTISWLYQFGETIHRPYVNFSINTGPDEGSAYVTALYFTLTSMTTVGFGNVSANTNAEKAFAVIVMLIGALMHAAIFGNVAAIIQKLYANRVRYHSRANEIKQFIRVHHIDGDLSNRLEDYFHNTWSLSGGVDTREILSTFPIEIQSDVCMHLYRGFLELPIFNQAPRGLVRMLSLQVRPVYIGPGEYLLMQNDVVNCIYYIASGSMEVLQGESVAAILGKGDVFGEDISRKVPIRRSNGDVRALTYCDIYYITRDLLQDVLHLYADFSYKFSEKLELTYDLGASERDIWRRGGLDSISEDEEENEDEISDSPETGSDVTYAVRNRFDMKPNRVAKRSNHFNANESWGLYSRPKIRGFDFNEKEPLLSTPEEAPASVSNVRVLQPSKKQISLSKEHNESNEQIDETNLEWEHEPYTIQNEEENCNTTDGELRHILVDPMNRDKESTENNDKAREYENPSPRPATEKSYKCAKDSFLKHLRSSGEDHEHPSSVKPGGEEIENESDDLEEEREDCLGFTEFVTPTQSPGLGTKRQFTRSPTISPTHSLNSNRSHRMRRSGNSLQRLDFPSSEGFYDNQRPEIFDSNQDSVRHSLSPAMDSPYVSISRLFALTPPPRDDSDCSCNVHCASTPSSPARFAGESGSRNSLRRNATTDLISPASSCGGLSDDRNRSTPTRRRKISTASAPPPAMFASLLAQASKSPYADFVPPKIVRESTITCNCEEEESCSTCGDKESSGGTLNGNLSSNEDSEDGCDSTSQREKGNENPDDDRLTFSDTEGNQKDIDQSEPVSCRKDFASQVSFNYLFTSPSNSTDHINGIDSQSANNSSNYKRRRRTRPLMTRDRAVDSSASQGENEDTDDVSYLMNYEGNASHSSQSVDNLDKTVRSETDQHTIRNDIRYSQENPYEENVRSEVDPPTRLTEDMRESRQNSYDKNLRSEVDPPTRLTEDMRESRQNSYDKNVRSQIDQPSLTVDTKHSQENSYDQCSNASTQESKENQETCEVPPFFDEVIANSSNENVFLCPHSEYQKVESHLNTDTKSIHSSISSFSSHPRTTLRDYTSVTDLSHSVSSFEINSTDNLANDVGKTEGPFHTRKPTISGIHSTYSLNDMSNSGRTIAAARAMSFSEPHLPFPGDGALVEPENDESEFGDMQLEDLFKDVVNAKQAMERLQMILASPEPTMTSDLADTKETVQRLDKQVLHLNEDVTCLRGDVKMVLELLKGLKNGQVVNS